MLPACVSHSGITMQPRVFRRGGIFEACVIYAAWEFEHNSNVLYVNSCLFNNVCFVITKTY